MQFPRNPADGQHFVVNGLAYIYNAAKKTWSYVKNTAGSTRDAGGFVIKNVGDARARPDGAADAMNRRVVEELIAANSLFQGTWHVTTNTPDLSPAVANPLNSYSWIAQTVDPKAPEVVGALGIAGLDGKTIDAGDVIIWVAKLNAYEVVKGAPLTLVNAMDVFVEESGDTMTGPLVLHGDPTDDLGAAPKRYVDSEIVRLVSGAITALDVGNILRKTGGVMTGPLGLAGAPTNDIHAATKKYVDDGLAGHPKLIVSDTEPNPPAEGMMWFSPTRGTIEVYDKGAWKETTKSTTATIAPTAPVNGELWFDVATKTLNYWANSKWNPINQNSTSNVVAGQGSPGNIFLGPFPVADAGVVNIVDMFFKANAASSSQGWVKVKGIAAPANLVPFMHEAVQAGVYSDFPVLTDVAAPDADGWVKFKMAPFASPNAFRNHIRFYVDKRAGIEGWGWQYMCADNKVVTVKFGWGTGIPTEIAIEGTAFFDTRSFKSTGMVIPF